MDPPLSKFSVNTWSKVVAYLRLQHGAVTQVDANSAAEGEIGVRLGKPVVVHKGAHGDVVLGDYRWTKKPAENKAIR